MTVTGRVGISRTGPVVKGSPAPPKGQLLLDSAVSAPYTCGMYETTAVRATYLTMIAKGHPLASKGKGQVKVHRKVLYDRIGPGPHPCHWCGKMLDWVVGDTKQTKHTGAIIADHVNEDTRDNRPENIVPSCHPCNNHRTERKSAFFIRHDEPSVVRADGNRTRGVEAVCCGCGRKHVYPKNGGRRQDAIHFFCSRPCYFKFFNGVAPKNRRSMPVPKTCQHPATLAL